jgi:metal-responsive CopG/Arc/MetJ family transcriptional regulator
MTVVKTAISIDEDLYAQAAAVASEMAISRSRLIALSLREFLRQRESRQLLEEINRTYSAEAEEEDLEIARAMRPSQRRVAAREP